jgi:polygalacturonase
MTMRIIPFCFAIALAAFLVCGCKKSVQTNAGQPPSVQAMASQSHFTPPNFPLPKFPDKTFNVKDFGATGNGETNDTPAIDAAIEKCSSSGGGTVYFPAGKYGAGSIHLKSNVRLLLDTNAEVFGMKGVFEAPEPNAFSKYQDGGHSHFHDSLFYGENVENVAIVGGNITGGPAIGHGDPKPDSGDGDKLITVVSGKNLDFENITHEKGGHFVYLLNDCVGVTLDGVVIKESRDAIDLMGCSDVQIHNCHFTGCADDTIGVKSDYALGKRINSTNIYVWDSYFESGCNGLQFGSETAGDFHNCNFWNIRIARAMKAGIGITSGDSAVIDDVNYSNIVVTGAACPIYMLVWDRMRTGEPGAKVGTIKNVHLQDITISNCAAGRQGPVQTSVLSGWTNSPFENITFENVKIIYPGGATNNLDNLYPPNPKDYSPRSFGPRPASAFYIRNGKGLTFKNVEFEFSTPDARTPLVIDNVDGVTLDNFKSEKSSSGATMKLINVKNLTVENSPGLKDQKGATVENGGE